MTAEELLAKYAQGERDFAYTDLIEANLSGADLSGINLSDTQLSSANLSDAKLMGTNLSGTDLSSADLSSADLSNADLINADLSGVNLSRANLSDVNLNGAKLKGANLSGANLINVILINADLSGADLSGTKLSIAKLSGVNLDGANLSGTDLSDADLSDVNFGSTIIPFNIAFRCNTPGRIYSFINAIDSEVISFASNIPGKSLDIKDGLEGYIGYVKHGEIAEGTSALGIKEYYTTAEPFDVSKFEWKGTVSSAHESSMGRIELNSDLRAKIFFDGKDLDPSLRGKIRSGTVVKFKLGIYSDNSMPCAINIRPY